MRPGAIIGSSVCIALFAVLCGAAWGVYANKRDATVTRITPTPTPIPKPATKVLEGGYCESQATECSGSLLCYNHVCRLPTPNDAKAAPVATAKPIPIKASTIISAYRSNELRADDEYGGNRYWITAQVSRVSKDILGAPHVWINNHAAWADFDSNDSLYDITAGEIITISCIVHSGVFLTFTGCHF